MYLNVSLNPTCIYTDTNNHERNSHATDDDKWIIAVSTIFPVIFVTAVTIFGILAMIHMHKPRSSGSIDLNKQKMN